MSRVNQILNAKALAGESAYLWLHDSGDCVLWPSEGDSIGDDGHKALERWQLNPAEVAELIETGECDEIA